MTVYRKTGHNAAPFENFFLHLQSCRRPDIELSKFYRRSLSRSHYNRPNRSLPSAWNNTFLRNRSIFSWYLCTPYIYLFHPRYLHHDIFRYVTRETTHDISRCYFTLYYAIIATGQTFQFLGVFIATFGFYSYLPWVYPAQQS